MEELDRVSVESFKSLEKRPVVVVLDNIRSANNVGSFFRTCDAFRVEKIYLCGITAVPPNAEIRKTALGATESVAWEYAASTLDIVRMLRDEGRRVLSVEQARGSIALDKYVVSPKSSYALVFGNEVKGVSQDVIDESDNCVEIPQWGTKHSLNVSVAGGIVLWAFSEALEL